MIVELVLFKSPPDKPRAEMLEEAKADPAALACEQGSHAQALYVGNDGFGGGLLYLAVARSGGKAHNAEWQAMVEKRTGSKPTFRYFDLLMLLDNEKGTVTEWPEPDRPVMIAAE
jgi:hypothetical protein